MPIEIKELVIKATVATGKNQQPVTTSKQAEILKMKKEITIEVMEKVLKTLQQKNER